MKEKHSKRHAVDRRRFLKSAAISVAATGTGALALPNIARAAQRYTIAFIPKSLSIPVFYFGHYGAKNEQKSSATSTSYGSDRRARTPTSRRK